MSRSKIKLSHKSLKENDQDSVRNARRSPVDWPFRKPYWLAIREKVIS